MKNCFLAENFLLSTTTSEKLYFQFAQHLPIFDYHCHVPPADTAQNKRYENLTRIWLAEGHYGDHYKWRAMRANGVPERYISGDASDYDKFVAFARTVPATICSVVKWSAARSRWTNNIWATWSKEFASTTRRIISD